MLKHLGCTFKRWKSIIRFFFHTKKNHFSQKRLRTSLFHWKQFRVNWKCLLHYHRRIDIDLRDIAFSRIFKWICRNMEQERFQKEIQYQINSYSLKIFIRSLNSTKLIEKIKFYKNQLSKSSNLKIKSYDNQV